MELVTRAQWGARPRDGGASTPFDPDGVAVHWVGGGWQWPWNHDSCDNKVRGIQDSHMDGNGWSDIAYNFLACPHGYVFEGRGLNRRSSANGDEDVNTDWYAVCCLWGSESGSAPQALFTAARDAIDHCRANGGAGNALRGHRDLNQTDCPGDQLYAWVRDGAPRPATPPTGDIDMWTDAQISQHLQQQARIIDLLEGQAYDRTETRKNTSLTATRLDSLVNVQFPAAAKDIDRGADATAGPDQ
jgi:hypothetical protein